MTQCVALSVDDSRASCILQVESYALTVVAVDGGEPARSGSLSVDIRVSDVIDDGPRFDHVTYDVTLTENAPRLTRVVTARATSDHADASIQYRFDDDTARRYGQVSSNTAVWSK